MLATVFLATALTSGPVIRTAPLRARPVLMMADDVPASAGDEPFQLKPAFVVPPRAFPDYVPPAPPPPPIFGFGGRGDGPGGEGLPVGPLAVLLVGFFAGMRGVTWFFNSDLFFLLKSVRVGIGLEPATLGAAYKRA